MDKKVLYGLMDEIVAQVAADNELEEQEARTFVGVALRRGKDAFLQTVVVPRLTVESTQKRTDKPVCLPDLDRLREEAA